MPAGIPTDEAAGTGVRTVDAQGRFAWERKTGKRAHVYFTGGGVTSNRIVIDGR